jgi:riboflavin kinase/FMN adenylyltransferase
MEVLRHPAPGDPRLTRAILTLGNFDGVHCGHQAILDRTVMLARSSGARAGLLTFHPHPATVLAPDKAPPLIVPLRGKLELLSRTGIDFVWIATFSRAFSGLSPEAFVGDYLRPRVGLVGMVVGYSVSFGKNRAGNAEVLTTLGARLGFDVEVVGPVVCDGLQVSSSAIRRVIGEGDVARAARLLGRPHRLWGRVSRGAQRGRELGFPTANVDIRVGLLPRDGVYAVHALTNGRWLAGVANVGRRPTFGPSARTVEVHLFDFDGDLYGEHLQVELIDRLRGERQFTSADELMHQIQVDAKRARALLLRRSGSDPQ